MRWPCGKNSPHPTTPLRPGKEDFFTKPALDPEIFSDGISVDRGPGFSLHLTPYAITEGWLSGLKYPLGKRTWGNPPGVRIPPPPPSFALRASDGTATRKKIQSANEG